MTALLNDFLSLSAVWGVLLTLAAFGLGALINRLTGKAFFNPLLLGSIFVIILLSVLKIPYPDYKESSAPVSYLLLPATISLAIPLYEKWDLLKENAAAIIAGISVGTFVSLGSALALALVFDMSHEQYVTILPKSVTTAISMDVAGELGGITALTGAIVILTGIVGNLLAEAVCKWFHITDPIAKGVGIGTSAHAVGTSKALQMGEVEGAMSGLSIAVAGILTAVLCPLFAQLLA
jgi:predicted murein hydrolase (TIGR00659 family)